MNPHSHIRPQFRHFFNYAGRLPGQQRGFTIVSAIFLLVVLAVLGAAIVTVSTTQSINAVEDYKGSSAYHAARAAVEWGVFKVLDPSTLGVTDPSSPGCGVVNGFWPPQINGFTISSALCTPYPATGYYSEADRRITVYELRATASSGTVGTVDYVERQIKVTVSRCRTTAGLICG